MNLQERVQERLRLWVSPRTRLLCAISGGPDSVTLAHLLKNLPYEVVLGHVDHRMRAGSARDASFVKTLAKRWALPYQMARVSVPHHAETNHLGWEEAARNLRYEALAKMAKNTHCSAILTAHTADDQAETILMNFLRGAGPAGLAGIPQRREVAPRLWVLRPLLDVSRQETLAYLRQQHLPYRQDPSNRSLRFTRNRIRLQVLPLLEKMYPGLKKRLVQMGAIFREEEGLWALRDQQEFDKTVRQNNQKITVDLPQLLGYHKALGRRILRRSLKGISFQDTERIFDLAQFTDGTPFVELSGGLLVERKGKELVINSRGFHE